MEGGQRTVALPSVCWNSQGFHLRDPLLTIERILVLIGCPQLRKAN